MGYAEKDVRNPWNFGLVTVPRTLRPWWTLLDSLRPEFEEAEPWLPPIDIRETEEAYHLEVEVPGLREEDVAIEVQGARICLRGERTPESEERQEGCRRTERRYGRFERSFEFEEGFDPDKVAARLEHGILHVTLPKREETKPKHIPVEVR